MYLIRQTFKYQEFQATLGDYLVARKSNRSKALVRIHPCLFECFLPSSHILSHGANFVNLQTKMKLRKVKLLLKNQNNEWWRDNDNDETRKKAVAWTKAHLEELLEREIAIEAGSPKGPVYLGQEFEFEKSVIVNINLSLTHHVNTSQGHRCRNGDDDDENSDLDVEEEELKES